MMAAGRSICDPLRCGTWRRDPTKPPDAPTTTSHQRQGAAASTGQWCHPLVFPHHAAWCSMCGAARIDDHRQSLAGNTCIRPVADAKMEEKATSGLQRK